MRNISVLCVAVFTFSCLTSGASAVVRSVSAEANSKVQSFVGGAEDSSDEANEVFGPDSGLDLPIDTRANLEKFDASNRVAIALAVAAVDDPTGGAIRNPAELSLEADCFSGEVDTKYEISSQVLERRVVKLSAAELRNPTGDSQVVESSFFVSGVLVAWSLDEQRDLTGLQGEFRFIVRKIELAEDGSEGDATVLLDETVSIEGGPGGSLTSSSSAGVFIFSGDLSILPDLPGVDNPDELGRVEIALILDQRVDYTYEAAVDAEFILEAEVVVGATNLPDRTGIGGVFGRPFDDLADILGTSLPDTSARVIQARLNRAMSEYKFQPPQRTLGANTACGALGVETIPLLTLSLALCAAPRFSRRKL